MSKMKTHKGAKKRFKISGSGKVMYSRQGRRHLLQSKSSKRKTRLSARSSMFATDAANIRELLPYS